MIIVSLSSPPLNTHTHTHTHITGRRDLIPNPILIPNGTLAGVRKSISPRILRKTGSFSVLGGGFPLQSFCVLLFLATPWTEFHFGARAPHCVVATIPGFVICPPPIPHHFFTLPHNVPGAKNGVRNAPWLVDILSCPCFTSVISATLKLCHGLRGFVVNHYLPLSDCSLPYTVDVWLSAASWVTNISC